MSPVVVVVAAFFVPLLDLIMAIIRRVKSGQSPFTADKMHLHHRLLGLGHSHRRVVLVMYAWVAVVSIGVVTFTAIPPVVAIGLCTAGLIAAAVFTLQPILQRRSRKGIQSSHARQ